MIAWPDRTESILKNLLGLEREGFLYKKVKPDNLL